MNINFSLIIARLLSFYSLIIWIRILITWLPSQRYSNNKEDGFAIGLIKKLADPFLKLFQTKKQKSGIDFSPLFALMTLNILQSVFKILAQGGTITPTVVLILILVGLWQYFFSMLFILLCIVLAIRWICGRNPYNPRNTAFMNVVDPIIKKPVNFVAKIFYAKRNNVTDQQYVLTALIFYVVLYFLIRWGLHSLIRVLSHSMVV